VQVISQLNLSIETDSQKNNLILANEIRFQLQVAACSEGIPHGSVYLLHWVLSFLRYLEINKLLL